jgi:hypothetical protein
VWLLCCAATGGSFKAVNETFVEHWAQDEECSGNLLQLEGPDGNVRNCEGEDEVVHNLFAFPAEDNFAGTLLQGKHLCAFVLALILLQVMHGLSGSSGLIADCLGKSRLVHTRCCGAACVVLQV